MPKSHGSFYASSKGAGYSWDREMKDGWFNKSSEASLVLSPILFIFKDILKGVHTIEMICHQSGALKAQVIQKVFYWHSIFKKSNCPNSSPNFWSFYLKHTKSKVVFFIHLKMQIYKILKQEECCQPNFHSIYIQEEKGLCVLRGV